MDFSMVRVMTRKIRVFVGTHRRRNNDGASADARDEPFHEHTKWRNVTWADCTMPPTSLGSDVTKEDAQQRFTWIFRMDKYRSNGSSVFVYVWMPRFMCIHILSYIALSQIHPQTFNIIFPFLADARDNIQSDFKMHSADVSDGIRLHWILQCAYIYTFSHRRRIIYIQIEKFCIWKCAQNVHKNKHNIAIYAQITKWWSSTAASCAAANSII